MKGIIALVAGIIAFITGTLSLIPAAEGIFIIPTVVFWLIGGLLGNRAWRNNRQVVGLIGALLAIIGFIEMLIALALAYFF